MFSTCLLGKILTSWKDRPYYIASCHPKCGIFTLSTPLSFSDLWYCLLKLIINKSSHLHVMLSMLCFHFLSLFNLCESHYSYLEACQFVTMLTSTRGSSNQCRPGLSEGEYGRIHSTIPHSKCFRCICWTICWLYFGNWNWFVHSSSICHLNILLSF